MAFSFIAPFIVATVVLVPKEGAFDKKQSQVPSEGTATTKTVEKPKDEGTIKLRKVAPKYKYIKVGKGKKAKKKKVLIKEAPSKTEFDGENLDAIYKKEREYFEKNRGAFLKRKKAQGGVSGALASIPAAVADSIAQNITHAKAERMPATPQPPPKPAAQTSEQLFNVEDTIQEKTGTSSKETKSSKQDKKIEQKLAELKEKKKSSKEKAVKPPTDAEIKNEIQSEVYSAVAGEDLTAIPEKQSSRGPSSIPEDPKKILQKVEVKYTTHFVKMDVKSDVTQALLERTKTYTGKLYLAPEGRFKMDMKEPNKHMLLMNGKNIWVVDYPLDETQDKVQILHSKSAKNLKNQGFLDIFTGVGNLQKRFKIESSDKKNDEITYKLIPKEKDAQVERVELKIDFQAELISSITFWDSLGNKTQLKFSEQDFSENTPTDIFKFKPPKDASITYL